MKVVFVDLETGGIEFYPTFKNGKFLNHCPILQVAALACNLQLDQGTCTIEETFESKVRLIDRNDCSEEALTINGYTEEKWVGAREGLDVCRDLGKFFSKHASIEKISKRTGNPYRVAFLGGHNISRFDGPLLVNWFTALGQFYSADFNYLDTLSLTFLYDVCNHQGNKTFPNYKLETICKELSIPYQGAHEAMSDVTATSEVALKLLKFFMRESDEKA